MCVVWKLNSVILTATDGILTKRTKHNNYIQKHTKHINYAFWTILDILDVLTETKQSR